MPDNSASQGKQEQLAKETLLGRFIEHAKGPKGLASLKKELAFAVQDIRQKVVEEGMYGQAVTPDATIHGARGDETRDPGAYAAKVDDFRALCEETREKHRDRPEIGGDRGPDR